MTKLNIGHSVDDLFIKKSKFIKSKVKEMSLSDYVLYKKFLVCFFSDSLGQLALHLRQHTAERELNFELKKIHWAPKYNCSMSLPLTPWIFIT